VLRAGGFPVNVDIVENQPHTFGNSQPLIYKFIVEYTAKKLETRAPLNPSAPHSSLIKGIWFSLVVVMSVFCFFQWFRFCFLTGRTTRIKVIRMGIFSVISSVLVVIIAQFFASHLPVASQTLSFSRIILAPFASRDDVDFLTSLPCWSGEQTGTLLEDATL